MRPGWATASVPECFARVQVLKYIFHTVGNEIWDLSDPTERIAYYELALVHGLDQMLHVRRRGVGRVADGDVGVVDGLALSAMDGGGVGQLDVLVDVAGG